MSVATKRERNTIGVLCQNRLQATVARKCVPKEPVHRDGRHEPRKSQAVQWWMVGNYYRLFSLRQGFLQVSLQRSNYIRREFLVVGRPADESAVIVSCSGKHL